MTTYSFLKPENKILNNVYLSHLFWKKKQVNVVKVEQDSDIDIIKELCDCRFKIIAYDGYKIDYDKKTVELIEVVALCKNCHNYIHSGRYQSMYDGGLLDEEDMFIVSQHGDSVLIDSGLAPCFEQDENDYKDDWNKWRLLFNGKEYGSLYEDYWAWYKEYKIK